MVESGDESEVECVVEYVVPEFRSCGGASCRVVVWLRM